MKEKKKISIHSKFLYITYAYYLLTYFFLRRSTYEIVHSILCQTSLGDLPIEMFFHHLFSLPRIFPL